MQNVDSSLPVNLQEIVDLFVHLPEQERRELLIAYSDRSVECSPREGESFTLSDVRKDEECTDSVGVFLKADSQDRLLFRMTLGPHVQTLTRAMASILCQGLAGSTAEEVMAVPSNFVPKIVGTELVRQRSQTVYYILARMKGACRQLLAERRQANLASSAP
ncbi:SufE family protein [Methylacidimicrobium sp. B4]|uniref:SufE family protein n=1 Tax=Methylacidimicrobium sp. B4 TaxID=2796139 RepID=UPI001A8ED1B5|nr:SufE family protein [Methylacidimicrobium sp. B4]QSR85080.1 SufE family protein [Methylacidimicrobium sp. B4]